MNEIIIKDKQEISDKILDEYLFSTKTNLSKEKKMFFYRISKEFGLNPFKREIYLIPYGQDFNIVTGYQVYIKRAEATGKLDGWEVVSGSEYATITIYRKDFSKAFRWCVLKSEFEKNTPIWRNMPDFMLKKVVIGQGFRLAFPNELSGLPYIEEELGSEIQSQAKESKNLNNKNDSKPDIDDDAEITILMNKLSEMIHEIDNDIEPEDRIKFVKLQKGFLKGIVKKENLDNAIKFYKSKYKSIVAPLYIDETETLPDDYFDNINNQILNDNKERVNANVRN